MVLYPHHSYLLANTLILINQQAVSFCKRVRNPGTRMNRITGPVITGNLEIRWDKFILFSLLFYFSISLWLSLWLRTL